MNFFDTLLIQLFDGWFMMDVQLIFSLSSMMVVAAPLTYWVAFKVYPKIKYQEAAPWVILAIIVASSFAGLLGSIYFNKTFGPTSIIETFPRHIKEFNLTVDLKFCQTGYFRDGQVHYTKPYSCGR